MRVTLVYINVKPEYLDRFVKATLYNHENSRKEPGNIRFDVLQDKEDPTKITLYEVFADDAALDHHKSTEHYKKWAEEAAVCTISPRTKNIFNAIGFN